MIFLFIYKNYKPKDVACFEMFTFACLCWEFWFGLANLNNKFLTISHGFALSNSDNKYQGRTKLPMAFERERGADQ